MVELPWGALFGLVGMGFIAGVAVAWVIDDIAIKRGRENVRKKIID